MKTLTIEAKTVEEAKREIAQALRMAPDYIRFDIEEKKGLLGLKKTYNVTGTVDVDPVDLGKETLETFFKNLDVNATINVNINDNDDIEYTIDTDENPVLIGKAGKTLEAIQYYLRNLVNVFTEGHRMVVVDIGGYKANRKKQLEILATKTAKEVARTKVPVKLDAMNAYERRIIHTKLSEWRDVVTMSEGEKPNRYLVIKPKKD